MITIKGKEYTLEELIELRDLIEKAMNYLDDTDAIKGTTLYPSWEDLLKKKYKFTNDDVNAGFRCQYKDVLYKVIQAHEIHEAYPPDVTVSLYARVLIPDENVVPEWEQPISTNGYSIGDRVTHNGKTWESLVNNNVYEPGAMGTTTVWKEVDGE